MSTPQFWRLTWGTYSALKRQWKYAQDRLAIPLAWIRADLHNAWLHEKGRPAYTAEDFLSARKRRQPWENDMQVFAAVAEAKGAIKPRGEEKAAALAAWQERARKKRLELQPAA